MDTLAPNVLRFIVLWLGASWQQRHGAQMDQRLMECAQWKAADVLTQVNVPISHVDSLGRNANERVRMAGYLLPDYYRATGNGVESLAYGWTVAGEALQALYESDAHRPHITGSDPFFTGQTYYGVGYAEQNNVGCYVLVTAPPEPVQGGGEVTIPVEPLRVFMPLVRT